MEPAPGKRIFKKYGNRRLYDTAASRYVNLDELAAFIRQGVEVQVVDAKTGEDLTRLTLMQIITEDAKDKPTGLPLELLRQLVVASGHVGREFIMWYLSSAFDAYRKVQGALEGGFAGLHSAAGSPLNFVRDIIQNAGAAPHEPPARNPEVEELRLRIAELEARLAKPKPARKPRKPTASKAIHTRGRKGTPPKGLNFEV